MILLELLEELKEVDAKAYEEHFKLVEITRYDFWPVWVADPITGEYSPESGIIFNSIIQASIQRACERQKWHWTIMKDPYQDGYRAEIAVVSESHLSDHICIDDLAIKCATSPTEALLAAYIAAVRAEAKR